MLTLPRIVERSAQPYAAIREAVTIPFGDAVDRAYGRLFGWLSQAGVTPAGAPFIKYNLVAMPHLEVEFGVPLPAPVEAEAEIVAGTLPAGRYATITYWGGYDRLEEVNAVLIGWAKQTGRAWDAWPTPQGERFAGRLEIYETDPRSEPDTSKWRTDVVIKLAEDRAGQPQG